MITPFPGFIRYWSTRPSIVFAVLALFTAVSIVGCNSNGATREYAPAVPVTRSFDHASALVYQRSMTVLQRSGYIITVSDAAAGIITAERYSTLDQSDKPLPEQQKMSVGETFLVFISFVLLFGFIVMLFADSSKSKDDTEKSKERKDEDHHRHDDHIDASQTVESYRYVLTLRIQNEGARSASVKAAVTEVTISNGTPLRTAAVNSSLITDGFFRLLTDELTFAP